VDKLLGAVSKFGASEGLFVSWSGFKSNVQKELAASFFRVRLWTQKELLEELSARVPPRRYEAAWGPCTQVSAPAAVEMVTRERPFRAPHHTISDAGLIGGGAGMPRPGEASLAHNGMLFLDEFPEFPRDVLEMLRQPLEDGSLSIARSSMTLRFPSSFMLVAAMNPCKCGFYGDATRECRCTPGQIQHYLGKISGPLLDRIDIHIEIPSVPFKELRGNTTAESSTEIRTRVEQARTLQQARGFYNSRMPARDIRKICALDDAGERTLEMAVRRMGLSARAHDRILKVARTIADLDHSPGVSAKHLAEAVQYRSLDRHYWS
jgi:magnesium chelatase family protein